MAFVTYSQNNSGGSFDYDELSGITHFVIVEADSDEEANERAEDIGLYFDGQGDCECCGRRWSDSYNDLDDEPRVYSTPAREYGKGWFAKEFPKGEIAIHYKDGTIEWIEGK